MGFLPKVLRNHKLRRAKLAGLVVDHLLADLVEAGLLGQVGDVAVHLAIDLNVLDHLLSVGLQSAVEVVEVGDATDLARRGVEEFGGNGLRQGVVALLLPARDEVVALLGDHLEEGRYLVGRVLEVGVHRDDDAALRLLETAVEGRALAVVAAKLDALDAGVLLAERLHHLPGLVGGTVVDNNYFVFRIVLVQQSREVFL